MQFTGTPFKSNRNPARQLDSEEFRSETLSLGKNLTSESLEGVARNLRQSATFGEDRNSRRGTVSFSAKSMCFYQPGPLQRYHSTGSDGGKIDVLVSRLNEPTINYPKEATLTNATWVGVLFVVVVAVVEAVVHA